MPPLSLVLTSWIERLRSIEDGIESRTWNFTYDVRARDLHGVVMMLFDHIDNARPIALKGEPKGALSNYRVTDEDVKFLDCDFEDLALLEQRLCVPFELDDIPTTSQ